VRSSRDFPHNHTHLFRPLPRVKDARHVRRAEEYIEAHAQRHITLSDLAAATGLAVRTLTAAFKAHRGVPAATAVRCATTARQSAHSAFASSMHQREPHHYRRVLGDLTTRPSGVSTSLPNSSVQIASSTRSPQRGGMPRVRVLMRPRTTPNVVASHRPRLGGWTTHRGAWDL
jgi:AraC-like DNA-binding protein